MDTEQSPKVSILIPTRDRLALLKRAIKSVQEQSFADWELIVLDNSVSETTSEFVSLERKNDTRLGLLRIPPDPDNYLGIADNLNKGILISRGKYIARLDDDDEWSFKDKLKEQVEYLDSHPDCVIVGGGVVVRDEVGKEVFRYLKKETDEEIRKAALLSNPFSHPTVVFRKDATNKIGGYGKWRYAEDWDLWLRLGKLGRFHNIQKYVTDYRLASSNNSFIHQAPQARMLLKIIWANRRGYDKLLTSLAIHLAQYVYVLLPEFIRKRTNRIATKWKRGSFN